MIQVQATQIRHNSEDRVKVIAHHTDEAKMHIEQALKFMIQELEPEDLNEVNQKAKYLSEEIDMIYNAVRWRRLITESAGL